MDGLRYSPDDPYYRLGPVHTCLFVQVRETGDLDLFLPWNRRGRKLVDQGSSLNGRGRKLVELTEGCYGGWGFQGLPGCIKYHPCPWYTHYQLSLKTLLANDAPNKNSGATNPLRPSHQFLNPLF